MESYLAAPPNSVEAAGNTEDNPLFEDPAGLNWHLRSDSPVKEAGLNLGTSFTNDREDNARSGAWSIGAYEQD